MYKPNDIVAYLLNGPGRDKRFGGLTNMKLQKLVYYIKVWSIVDGSDVVDGPFEKWTHGPVVRDLYDAIRINGKNPVNTVSGSAVALDARAQLIADVVMYTYGRLSAFELSDLTHSEDPWRLTAANAFISPDVIEDYYKNQYFAANFPVRDDRPFFPLLTASAYAFSFDMSDELRKSMRTYRSFAEYRKVIDNTLDVFTSFRLS